MVADVPGRGRLSIAAHAVLASTAYGDYRSQRSKMAELTSMTQSQLSRIERRDDHLLSTIRRYVEAPGGTVEIVAVVRGKRVKLEGV